LRSGSPTVEIVPGTSIVLTFPAKCVTVWNDWYAEPHVCGPDDLSGEWYAPYATYTETSVRLDIPAAKLAEHFQLTRKSDRVDLSFYDAFTETGDLAAARAWVANPGDWVVERTQGRDGVTLVGAASELVMKVPIGGLVCVDPKRMGGLARREPDGGAADSNDPRFRYFHVQPVKGSGAMLWLGYAAVAGGTSYAGWMIGQTAPVAEDSTRDATSFKWTFWSAFGGVVGTGPLLGVVPLALSLDAVAKGRSERARESWIKSTYEQDGLDVPAVGGELMCSSTSWTRHNADRWDPEAPRTQVKLLPDAPAGVNFSTVRVWAPTYPDNWVSVTKTKVEDVRVGADQLKELFGY
jgi:hypothetical protein